MLMNHDSYLPSSPSGETAHETGTESGMELTDFLSKMQYMNEEGFAFFPSANICLSGTPYFAETIAKQHRGNFERLVKLKCVRSQYNIDQAHEHIQENDFSQVFPANITNKNLKAFRLGVFLSDPTQRFNHETLNSNSAIALFPEILSINAYLNTYYPKQFTQPLVIRNKDGHFLFDIFDHTEHPIFTSIQTDPMPRLTDNNHGLIFGYHIILQILSTDDDSFEYPTSYLKPLVYYAYDALKRFYESPNALSANVLYHFFAIAYPPVLGAILHDDPAYGDKFFSHMHFKIMSPLTQKSNQVARQALIEIYEKVFKEHNMDMDQSQTLSLITDLCHALKEPVQAFKEFYSASPDTPPVALLAMYKNNLCAQNYQHIKRAQRDIKAQLHEIRQYQITFFTQYIDAILMPELLPDEYTDLKARIGARIQPQLDALAAYTNQQYTPYLGNKISILMNDFCQTLQPNSDEVSSLHESIQELFDLLDDKTEQQELIKDLAFDDEDVTEAALALSSIQHRIKELMVTHETLLTPFFDDLAVQLQLIIDEHDEYLATVATEQAEQTTISIEAYRTLQDELQLSQMETAELQDKLIKLQESVTQTANPTTSEAMFPAPNRRACDTPLEAQTVGKWLVNQHDVTGAKILSLIEVYENVVVLDTAYSHAKLISDRFTQYDKLFNALHTLSTTYLDAINSGSPDSVARRCFTTNMYAANESKTVEQSKELSRHRQFTYQGKTQPFYQHLRLGVDSDYSVRVYFKIIEGKLVIAYLGKHLPTSTGN